MTMAIDIAAMIRDEVSLFVQDYVRAYFERFKLAAEPAKAPTPRLKLKPSAKLAKAKRARKPSGKVVAPAVTKARRSRTSAEQMRELENIVLGNLSNRNIHIDTGGVSANHVAAWIDQPARIAGHVLQKLARSGTIVKTGDRRSTRYSLAPAPNGKAEALA